MKEVGSRKQEGVIRMRPKEYQTESFLKPVSMKGFMKVRIQVLRKEEGSINDELTDDLKLELINEGMIP